MLRLLLAQRERGHEAELACPEAPAGSGAGVADRARAAGVEPICRLVPARGVRPCRDAPDARRLRVVLEERGFGVLHTWHTRDHVLAWRASRRARRAARARVVRSYASAERIPRWPWNRLLYGLGTDALLCPSRGAAQANAGLCRAPAVGVLGAVDLARFAPQPPDPALRASLGLGPQQRVVGIVARVQRHRRFDLLLEAMVRLARRDPDARLLVVGRGTHLDSVARRPAAKLGIADRVIFAGYREADYADVLRAIDVFTFLVPGSDGSCRALLEAHACGIPAVTSRRGALPEIVADSETGLLVDEDPEALCAAWQELLTDSERRARMGRSARERAERCFDPGRLAEQVETLYCAAGVSR
jgi:glycosyltransferase involved in cell wall biosynthesis